MRNQPITSAIKAECSENHGKCKELEHGHALQCESVRELDIQPAILVQCLEERAEQLNVESSQWESDGHAFRILMALRHIIHHMDSYSRELAVKHKITGPQLVCLHTIVKNGPLTLSELGKIVGLSMSTINGIIDRLEHKELVFRERKLPDRRKVFVTATPAGRILRANAPVPLQGRLIQAISELPEKQQISLAVSLEKVLGMMKDDDAK